MKRIISISLIGLVLLGGCSVKKNTFFSRNYHRLTTRYNVYFNGDQALKSGLKNMENRHKEDYTNLLPVFVSNNEQTRALCSSDMDYAIEKAAKAIDKHSITAKPRRRKNKDSKNYQTFRKKREFNPELDRCYLLLGKAYFYKKKYAMANNTFRFIQRQYPEEKELLTETALWMFRSLTEMKRYEEAEKALGQVDESLLKRRYRELLAAARTDFYVRQGMYSQAVPEAEKLVNVCKSMKRKPRYRFMLSQLYLKNGQDGQAMLALKKAVRFNFNYEMVFNAKINMALAYQEGDAAVEKKLKKMLRDAKNDDFRDRIYYALGNIEERRGDEKKAIDMYGESVRTSVDNENQQALSFCKLGDYYFKERDYMQAQACYDSCMFLMDSRYEDYDRLRVLLTDLTDLVNQLNTIQLQDSLQRLAALPEAERNRWIEEKIENVREQERLAQEQEKREQAERNFYNRNNMINRGNAFSQNSSGGEWYFYNPVTIALGKNEFKRKWGRRKLEDNWRRQNKAMIEYAAQEEDGLAESIGEEQKVTDVKSREYYLKDLPLTDEAWEASEKKVEEAYYKAGELYMYKFDDPEKALECFGAYVRRFKQSNDLPMAYYLAYQSARKAGKESEAEQYKEDLLRLFPESDFAKGLDDPSYFRKVGDELKVVDRLYAQAYDLYRQVYYDEAEKICDRILVGYPENKLRAHVLFLKAMCILNTRPDEARAALEQASAAGPDKEMAGVIGQIMAGLSVGEKPVVYSPADMADARYRQANRNWKFDEEVVSGKTKQEETTFRMDPDRPQHILIVMPEDFNLVQETRFKARIAFINASEAAEGKNYEIGKEELWYKTTALSVQKFSDYKEASGYLNRVATDKYLLKIIGDRNYRIFAIDEENLEVLKRVRNIEKYVDFFAENYFDDRQQGEILTGKWGTAAHVFNYVEDEKHDLVLALPFREVNVKRIADLLHQMEPAFEMSKENYGNVLEMIIMKNIGGKVHALEFMNMVLKDKEIFDRLTGVDYDVFVITEQNMQAMIENEYYDEYLKFFADHYLKSAGAVGVEVGDYIYNKNVPHQFVLLYSNKVDPYKLKAVFEEFNFAGLSLSNQKFDDEYDCMIVSSFENKAEAMRYFKMVIGNRKLFRSLKNTEYTNFISTQVNLETLKEKKDLEAYLDFFKKYYLQ